MATFNGSGWPQVRGFLERMRHVSIAARQELHLTDKARLHAEEWCQKRGWKACITDAVITDAGKPSAG
eukprot:4934519-Pyramimonas_sp.AAC.1